MKCIISILNVFKATIFITIDQLNLIGVIYNIPNTPGDVQHYHVEELLVSKINIFVRNQYLLKFNNYIMYILFNCKKFSVCF